MIQHVMYKDILANRMYVSYPYYDRFDIDNKQCLYCYRDNEMDLRDYVDKVTSPDFVKVNTVDRIRENYELSDEDADKILALFSSKNPAVRLTVYAGGRVDKAKVFQDICRDNDTKRTFIELTGEINAIAMDGLFSLYASALYYLEGKEDTDNAKKLVKNYKRLIDGAYIFMKRGSAMDFFYMPIADIEQATHLGDVDMLMESANTFTDVYLRNNGISHNVD